MSSNELGPAPTEPESSPTPPVVDSSPAIAASDQPAVEPDSPVPDDRSTYSDEVKSYTMSLRSSIYDYEYENGRRYHAYRAGSYPIPNDELESDRLDMFHHVMTLSLNGKLHLAPLDKGVGRILDIGTGTGIWAIQMGDEYPETEVLGVDLSPIQPPFVPVNVRFEVDDVESPWQYASNEDLNLTLSICNKSMDAAIGDWPRLFNQTLENLKPGGWAEFHGFDFHLYSDDKSVETKGEVITQWCNMLLDGYDKLGRESTPGPKLAGWAKDAGFVNVKETVLKYPVGLWPKDKHLVGLPISKVVPSRE
ncbi:MAG: hypothetical protein M1840_002558 [Geoglossum simile]|nr:MAG: hypothetical protein M1840_002558 [Geoglossum simile]